MPDKPEWPVDGSPASLLDIVLPLEAAFKAGATWQVRQGTSRKDIPWTGLSLPHVGYGCPEAQLSADWRENSREQGRTFLMTMLTIAVQLGMEQGRRLERLDIETKVRLIEVGLLTATSAAKELKARQRPAPAADSRADCRQGADAAPAEGV